MGYVTYESIAYSLRFSISSDSSPTIIWDERTIQEGNAREAARRLRILEDDARNAQALQEIIDAYNLLRRHKYRRQQISDRKLWWTEYKHTMLRAHNQIRPAYCVPRVEEWILDSGASCSIVGAGASIITCPPGSAGP